MKTIWSKITRINFILIDDVSNSDTNQNHTDQNKHDPDGGRTFTSNCSMILIITHLFVEDIIQTTNRFRNAHLLRHSITSRVNFFIETTPGRFSLILNICILPTFAVRFAWAKFRAILIFVICLCIYKRHEEGGKN